MFEEWLSVPQTKLQREIDPQPLSGRHSVTLGKRLRNALAEVFFAE